MESLIIKKLKLSDLDDIFNLNKIHKKEYHTIKQKMIFSDREIDNVSYGIFNEGVLNEYIVAYKKRNTSKIEIENFIWKNSESYIRLISTIIDESRTSDYSMYICDKGLRIFLKLMDKYFTNSFQIRCETKRERYGEVLNYIEFTINA